MTGTNGKSSPLAVLQETKLPLWVSLLLVLLVVAVFIWKQTAVGAMDTRLQGQAQQFESDKTALRTEAANLLAQNSEAAHRLLGTALAWAIRGELIRNNLDQIDQYLAELVKVEGIKLAVLADPSGKVLVASDKKYQGGELSLAFPAAVLNETAVAVLPGQEGTKLLVMPVMGLNTRLGTAVVNYTPESISQLSR